MSLNQKVKGKESFFEWKINNFKEMTNHKSPTFQIEGYMYYMILSFHSLNLSFNLWKISLQMVQRGGLFAFPFAQDDSVSYTINLIHFREPNFVTAKGKVQLGIEGEQILTIFHEKDFHDVTLFVVRPHNVFSPTKNIVTIRCTFVRGQETQGESSLFTGGRSVKPPLQCSPVSLEHATQTEASHYSLMRDISTNTEAEQSTLLETLSQDLECFYDNKTNADCVLKVGESQFSVHRAVLSARSVVFAAMFNHNTKENLSGEVDIPDVQPTTLSDVLFYVYSGKIRGLTPDTAVSMYTVADKYALCKLRKICLDVLLNSLTTENICDAAVLAYMHGETTLEKKVIHFIADRLEEFMESDKWAKFAQDRCLLANKLLCSAVITSKKKNTDEKS